MILISLRILGLYAGALLLAGCVPIDQNKTMLIPKANPAALDEESLIDQFTSTSGMQIPQPNDKRA